MYIFALLSLIFLYYLLFFTTFINLNIKCLYRRCCSQLPLQLPYSSSINPLRLTKHVPYIPILSHPKNISPKGHIKFLYILCTLYKCEFGLPLFLFVTLIKSKQTSVHFFDLEVSPDIFFFSDSPKYEKVLHKNQI